MREHCARRSRGTSASWPDELSGVGPTFAATRAAAVPALAAHGTRARRDRASRCRVERAPASGQPDRRSQREKASLLVPDAFSNPEYVRFAVRGGLACLICTVLFVGFDYPGIYTSVITCFVVSLSTVGASTQKGILRFAGSAVGGAMGILALMYVFPHVETLGGFWAVFATGTALAAWVNFGSPRVSYGGYQIGLAFYKVILQGWGPVTSLDGRARSPRRHRLRPRGVRHPRALPLAGARERSPAAALRRCPALSRRPGAPRRRDRPGAAGIASSTTCAAGSRRIWARPSACSRSRSSRSRRASSRPSSEARRRAGHLSRAAVARLSAPRVRTIARGSPGGRSRSRGGRGGDLEAPGRSDASERRGVRRPISLPGCARPKNALASAGISAPADEVVTAVEQRLQLYRTLVRLVSRLDPWAGESFLVHTIGGADRALTNAEHRS